MQLKKLIAAGLIAVMPMVLVACGDDEDGDGAVTDEEISDASDAVDNAGDELEEEIDEAGDEMSDTTAN